MKNKFLGHCIELNYAVGGDNLVFSQLLLRMSIIKCCSLLCALWKLAEFGGLISVLHWCKMEIRPTELM